MEPKSCCFCLSTKQGATAIGVLSLLDLVRNLLGVHLIGIALRMFTAVQFCLVLKEDTKSHRFGFFAAFATQVALELAGEVLFGMWVEASTKH